MFTARDFNQDLLLRIIDANESICFDINKDICLKIMTKFKKSKYLNFEKMDIVTEFAHVF